LAELRGADVTRGLLDAAPAANPGVGYHPYDGVTLPFGHGSFDASFAICVLHRLEPPARSSASSSERRGGTDFRDSTNTTRSIR